MTNNTCETTLVCLVAYDPGSTVRRPPTAQMETLLHTLEDDMVP